MKRNTLKVVANAKPEPTPIAKPEPNQLPTSEEQLSLENYRIISHRCLGYGERENSAAALEKALQSPVREFELDLRLTSDKRLITCHDPAYLGVDFAPRIVSRTTLSRAERDGLMPLSQLLDIFKQHGEGKHLQLELKVAGAEEMFLRECAHLVDSNQLTVISWNPAVLLKIHTLAPTVPLSFSFAVGPWAMMPRSVVMRTLRQKLALLLPLVGRGFTSVNLAAPVWPVTGQLIAAVNSFGLEALATGLESIDAHRRFLTTGGVGAIVDNPSSLYLDLWRTRSLYRFRPEVWERSLLLEVR